MPTLGDRLRQIEKTQAEEQVLKDAAEKQAAERAEQARRETVRKFFADAQRLTIETIGAGKIPPDFVTPIEVEGNGTFTILDPRHPDHGIYSEFLVWARSEGLTINGQHHHADHRSAAKLTIKAAK
jgi:hypothetical protein